MGGVRGMIVRDVTPREYDWLEKPISAGRSIFKYLGCTYGCISPNGVAVSDKDGETPFYEVPLDSVRWLLS